MDKYSIVFTDLDGTLLKKDKTISERTMQVIKNIRRKGILWVVATARPEVAINMYDELKYADALITLNGARIRLHDKVISNGFTPEEARKILKVLTLKDGLVLTVETSGGIFGNIEIPEWETPEVEDFTSLVDTYDIYKILIAGRDHELPTIRQDRESFCSIEELDKTVKDSITSAGLKDSVYFSVAEGWLYQIMSRNATKWKGCELILKTEGISAGQAVYFGDDNDDADCISNAGLGVAMGNAIDRVKEVSDITAPSNEEDGVAKVLEELLCSS
ncbi:MAG: HAD-IIB family hydrolase [Saccharofermentans sp.]|nr:HAD-IIB family hydrolase [Saccharofermentans sp.]